MYDIFNAPLEYIHELYYYTFQIRDAKDKEQAARDKEEEEKKKAQDKLKEMNKRHPMMFDKRLSPAAQARESKRMSQNDDKNNSEDLKHETTAGMPSMDIEDLVDVLEEGG